MSGGKILPFNPLDKKHLGESVGQAMLRQPIKPLGGLPTFEGAGIYAIYYSGDFDAYQEISKLNQSDQFMAPIYIGKAAPAGSRKGGDLSAKPGKVLHKRLSEHSKSIEEVENLHIEDFHCRFLIVDDIWIPLGESLLIAKFNPIWNKLIDGFGNHDPGKGRHAGLRPRWDVLHPGRGWADNCAPREESMSQIKEEAREYIKNTIVPLDAAMITT